MYLSWPALVSRGKTLGLCCLLLPMIRFGCHGQSTVDLIIRRHDEDILKRVETGITELTISNAVGDETYFIEGLEKLPRLRKLRLVILGRLEDISFLSKLNKLEILIIDRCGGIAALPPLEWFPSLRQYVMHGLVQVREDPSSYRFDLKATPRLEYLQVTACRLIALPTVLNVPASLRYVNFAQNEIGSVVGKLRTLEVLRQVKHVFLDYNRTPAEEVKAYPNVTLSGIFSLLPKELMYTY